MPVWYYPSITWYQRTWETVKSQEWEKVYRGWLETYRRMMQYHLQWGTPTGPYWAPIPTRPWWADGDYWRQVNAMVVGQPPYNPAYAIEAWHNPRHRLLPQQRLLLPP